MSKKHLRQNWREYAPPMIPAYFIDIEALKELLDRNPQAIGDEARELMLGYFEEYEEFEKAAVLRDNKWKQDMFADELDYIAEDSEEDLEDYIGPPPDDGHKWEKTKLGWSRRLTEDEIRRYFSDEDEDDETISFNPFDNM